MEKGDFVKVDYIGKLENGEIFDLTKEDIAKKEKVYNEKLNYGPITIVLGAKFVIAGLEKALMDMKVGDKKTIEIAPEDGFGPRKPDMVQVVNKKVFAEKNVEPQQGLIVDFGGLKGRIQSVSSGRVTVDFNNPMAGKKLIYDLEVIEKVDDPNTQVKSLTEFFGSKDAVVTINGSVVEIEADLPQQLKERIYPVIIENVKPEGKKLEKVKFTQTYPNSKE
jgi:FKBP-type peptidyl-prolyl cis-trans isomerase 2